MVSPTLKQILYYQPYVATTTDHHPKADTPERLDPLSLSISDIVPFECTAFDVKPLTNHFVLGIQLGILPILR